MVVTCDSRPTCANCRLDADQDIPETKQKKVIFGLQPLCWLSLLNGFLLALLVMLVIVRLVTPDREIGAFPSGCSESLPIGCSRIAEEHPQRDEGQEPVALTSPATLVAQTVKEWAMDRHGKLLDFSHGDEAEIFLHFRFLSTLWGFPDDFLVLVRCTSEVRQNACMDVMHVGFFCHHSTQLIGPFLRRASHLLRCRGSSAWDMETWV